MRKPLATAAVVLGILGVLLCTAAIGIGWWAAARTAARTQRVADRVDLGLSEFDAPLSELSCE